jgi:hypothetical protein
MPFEKLSRRSALRFALAAGVAGVATGAGDPAATVTAADADPTQVAKLAAADGDLGDYFGGSVAVSADGATALVGAALDEDPNGDEAGSAYVFAREDGDWRRTTKLVPDGGDHGDNFGESVAVSSDGTTALIGSVFDEDPNGDNAGSAYVFAREGGAWRQTAKLATDDGDPGDYFGRSVAVSGDGSTALVGADNDEDPNGMNEDDRYSGAGSAYVFVREGGAWRQIAKLAPDDGDSYDLFGRSVAVSSDGTTVLVGAVLDEDPNGEYAGSAYVFAREGGAWRQTAKLAPDDGDPGDYFGGSVAVSSDGSTALVGALYDEDPNGDDAGSAYVFAREGGAWRQTAKLAPDDGDPVDHFGEAVAVSGDGATALVGAPRDEDPNGPTAGSAYMFAREGGAWRQTAKLAAADDDDTRDHFGEAVAVSGDGATALVGAPRDADPNGPTAGSGYIFRSTKESPVESPTNGSPRGTDTQSSGTAPPIETESSGGIPGFGSIAGVVGFAGFIAWRYKRNK